jgi:erythromycin esterase-like protein
MSEISKLTSTLKRAAAPLKNSPKDYDPLMDLIGDSSVVLLGEESHGTHEFYDSRAEITKRLIKEKGFKAVAVEADWPDSYRVNRYVRGVSEDATVLEALEGFKRFPQWMWRNTDVLGFVDWMRYYNDSVGKDELKVGFYGLDLYSLNSSIEEVLRYLEKVDPEAARRARYRYSCFEHFGEDTQAYGYAASFGLADPCEDEVINQLIELRRKAAEYASRDGRVAADEFYYAEQNARLIKNAEQYYRSMFQGRISSWNLRDRHMVETLNSLIKHIESQGQRAKVVVWEHNSHIGDARVTEMSERGELNVGQLVREQYGKAAVLVGYSTYTGTVTAASNWGAPAERKRVRPALKGSYESLFHSVSQPNFLLNMRDDSTIADILRDPRLERAIGVIYLPETERISHYFYAQLPEQFDAVLHFDETTAVEPLERTAEWEAGEVPETYPYGI